MAKITLAKNAGFCMGVKRAFDKTLELSKSNSNVVIFGELIHNRLAVSYLEDRGVKTVFSLDEINSDQMVVIRAHGETTENIDAIEKTGAEICDCTCLFVKKIHKIVKEYSDKGYKILIAGDQNHAEVIGISSYAGGNFEVFSDNLPISENDKKICVVFQTTFSIEKAKKIIEDVEKISKDSKKSVVLFNTICYTTHDRQVECLELAKNNDAVLVVGNKISANTTRLYNLAKSVNKNVYFIESLGDISRDIKSYCSIAIVAGASTPKWLLEEVVNTMSETQKEKVAMDVTNETEMQKEATSTETAKAMAAPEKELTMEDIMASNSKLGFIKYTPGKKVVGTVLSADEKGIHIALGGKKDGFVAKEDASLDGEYNPDDFKNGDEIEAIILSQSKENVSLSKKLVDQRRIENEEAEKALNNGIFELVMTEVVKGGLRGRMGSYTVFVPASQIRIGYVKNLEDYKGKKLRLVQMPPKAKEGEEDKPQKKSRYIFASQRMVLEAEKKEKEDAFWNSIHVHDIVVGKVKRFTQIGAFVNVKGYDCLCHISEISWNTINDASTVLTLNESYDFVVLKMDRESGKISLGYKQLQKKPYEIAAEKFPVGTVVKGKVARIKPYGAFVQIDEGVDGLVHVSQIAHNWVKDATEVFQVGQEIEAKIISFDENRITLSMKELLPEPTEEEISIDDETYNEKMTEKRASRVKKFEQGLAQSGRRNGGKAKREAKSNEPKEWISQSGTATLGDLFKGLDLNFDEENKD